MKGAPIDLGTLGGASAQALAVNDAGQVVGKATTSDSEYYQAFRYDFYDGRMHNLGRLPGDRGSTAFGINDHGDVVGLSTPGSSGAHAFLYDHGTVRNLGTLAGGTTSAARGINDDGIVVGSASTAASGSCAFVYDGTTMVNLNDLLPANSGWILHSATAINNDGLIVGYGIHNNLERAFAWRISQPEADTTTTVVASPPQSTLGQAVTFTATVSANSPGPGTPTGYVTFEDTFESVTTTLGTAVLGTSGGVTTATFTARDLAVGSHSIKAAYYGDSTFNPSTSGAAGETVGVPVQRATTTVLNSSAATSVYGQLVTFTVTVSSGSPDAPAPTGTVVFMDGGKSIGSVTRIARRQGGLLPGREHEAPGDRQAKDLQRCDDRHLQHHRDWRREPRDHGPVRRRWQQVSRQLSYGRTGRPGGSERGHALDA
jgi:probable HAF family extracellular repeat protein